MSELESLFSAAVPATDPNTKSSGRGSVGNKPEKVQLVNAGHLTLEPSPFL